MTGCSTRIPIWIKYSGIVNMISSTRYSIMSTGNRPTFRTQLSRTQSRLINIIEGSIAVPNGKS
jgi:hypothetical protein